MVFSGSDEGNADGFFSFENIGKMEAAKTSAALQDIDTQLQSIIVESPDCSDGAPGDSAVGDEAPFEYYRRVESNGYDAHSESVDKKELLTWQRAFPYFAINGERVNICGKESSTVEDEFYSMRLKREESTQHEFFGAPIGSAKDLFVRGTSSKISVSEVNLSDVYETHGTLVELLAVHRGPKDEQAESEDSVVNQCGPYVTRREEIVSLLLDAVWPEVVEALRPLVGCVVKASRAANLTYDGVDKISSNDDVCYEDEGEMNSADGYASW
jgi:hypothetical protein